MRQGRGPHPGETRRGQGLRQGWLAQGLQVEEPARTGDSDDVIGEHDVRTAARLERDGMCAKMFQHVKDSLEPQMLHTALSFIVDSHA